MTPLYSLKDVGKLFNSVKILYLAHFSAKQ